MTAVVSREKEQVVKKTIKGDAESLKSQFEKSWKAIAPFWPLENLIAVNPLRGLENLPIEEAILLGESYLQEEGFPKEMEAVNRETIKWIQAYFDKGQATIAMPLKALGLYSSWKQLVVYDKLLHRNSKKRKLFLESLPESSEEALSVCLGFLNIQEKDRELFFRLLLVSLPGWASYVKYKGEWSGEAFSQIQADYLALRVIIFSLFFKDATALFQWNSSAIKAVQNKESIIGKIEQFEQSYRVPLLDQLKKQTITHRHVPKAQLVFCIDVRSEQFRRSLEATGDYETLGCAGFFGIPSQITDPVTGESYASCPVLLSPKHEVKQCGSYKGDQRKKDVYGYESLVTIKKIYQSLKYTFVTPFALAEGIGLFSGAWIALRTFAPNFSHKLRQKIKNFIRKPVLVIPSISEISFEEQCAYAEGGLRVMGLTDHFAPLVVFCGHGSSTENNPYASGLDCGACGGRHGCSNAQILAQILNQPKIRGYLGKQGIHIPQGTIFMGAKHNTTTDEVVLFDSEFSRCNADIKKNLERAREVNSSARLQKGSKQAKRQSQDWAQVRPEWGLARNAAFIIAPRDLTKSLDLQGRCFLHSYDYKQDASGGFLETILTAPMVVAEWINTQYLFSTLDNVAYGGGSKITKNITGKIGIMQGNASDLMTGLPLQSVYSSDKEAYHEMQRLMTVVYAPISQCDPIIAKHEILQKLCGNGWVQIVCIDPESSDVYFLQRDFSWKRVA